MRPLCLFIPSTALPLRSTCHSNVCPLQRPVRMSVSGDNGEIGEPSWMELSRTFGKKSEKDPERPAPEWKLPEGDPNDFGDEPNPWKTWNESLERDAEEQPSAPRDPKAETDFWRGAAREAVPDKSIVPDANVKSDNSPSEIWGQARNVTGEMSEVQDKLRSELEQFDLDETTDQYRDIARELVGPPPEPWEDREPLRRSEAESDDNEGVEEGKLGEQAEAGSGWNPDVDWMRFDDIRREKVQKMQREEREKVAAEAQSKRDAFKPKSSDENITYTDESGRVLSAEEVKQAIEEGAVFLDESGKELDPLSTSDVESTLQKEDASDAPAFDPNAPVDQLPGFLANKFRSSSTYGAGWSEAENEMKALEEKGIPLRDPKADADAWRSAARDLNFEIEPALEDSVESENIESSIVEVGDEEVVETGAEESETDGETLASSDEVDATFEEDSDRSLDESNLWSTWRSGNAGWEEAASKAPPRDPKQEVDMWRVSARELTADVPATSTGENSEAEQGEATDEDLWNTWRNADKQWKVSLNDPAGSDASTTNTWSTESGSSDWGSGLEGKTSSERSAWESWNNAGGQDFGTGTLQTQWWDTRSDGPSRFGSPEKKSQRTDVDEWRQIARETTNLGESSSPNAFVQSGQEAKDDDDGKGAAIEFWKTAVKDLSIDTSNSEESSVEEEG